MTNPTEDKLPTDWAFLCDLWEDIERFALEHPHHTFLCADDKQRMGWVAFLPAPEGAKNWDEQMKTWTIPHRPLQVKFGREAEFGYLRHLIATAAGRKQMMDELKMRVGSRGWDLRFLELAKHISSWSKDPSTKVGCVIVGPDREIRSTGFNGFPRGIPDTLAHYKDREKKYSLVCHAEANALHHAVRIGVTVKGCTAYCTWAPCSQCAKSLAQSGIAQVVYPADVEIPERWRKDFDLGHEILKNAGVRVHTVT